VPIYKINMPGGQANMIVADQPFVEEHYPGQWELVPDAPQASDPPPEPRHATRLAFRNRFTAAEKVTLEMASLDDPSAPMAQRQQAAALRVSLEDVKTATFIDLDRHDTRTGVQAMEAAGLLAVGRAAEILDAPLRPEERYTGAPA